jgi:hypothetical protein
VGVCRCVSVRVKERMCKNMCRELYEYEDCQSWADRHMSLRVMG